jgi:hypothetical protein
MCPASPPTRRSGARNTGLFVSKPSRWAVQRTIFHLLDEPVRPGGPLPRDDLLPGAYELHLLDDDVTIWYTVTEHEGQQIISVQHVSLDT